MSFNSFLQSCRQTGHYLINKLRRLKHAIGLACHYCYTACDMFVKRLVIFFGAFLDRPDVKEKHRLKQRYFRLAFTVASLIAIFSFLLYVLIKSVYIVPVGGGAVVTRFGKYNRMVDAGIHLRLPIAEQYYIVFTGYLMEERFGFLQSVTPHNTLDPNATPAQQARQAQYEAEVIRRESDLPDPQLSRKGSLIDALGQKQRLPNDYIRRKIAEERGPLTPDEAVRIVNEKDRLKASIEQKGMSLNGRLPVLRDALLITSDLNVVYLTWALQYQISDPRNYLFNSRDVQRNIREIGFAAMSQVVGDFPFKEVITTGRQQIENAVGKEIQRRLDQYHLGITVNQVIVLDALPPPPVLFAFNEVNRASQDMEKTIYQAQRSYLQRIPKAQGEAQRIRANAQAYATEVVNEAKGEAGRFDAVRQAYEQAPGITKDRMYLETMQNVLKKVPNTVIDKKVQQGILPVFLGGTPAGTAAPGNILPRSAPATTQPSTPPATTR